MRIEIGDIWERSKDHFVVIPTNIGWTRTIEAVMGAGLAKDAALRYPGLVKWYGRFCQTYGKETPVAIYPDSWYGGDLSVGTKEEERVKVRPIVLFPTKPLNEDRPELSWKFPSDLGLIEKSTRTLVRIFAAAPKFKVALPLVGCGLGGLSPESVMPILEKYLVGDQYVLVLRRKDLIRVPEKK